MFSKSNVKNRRQRRWWFFSLVIGLGSLLLAYQIPAVRSRLEWRLDAAAAFVRVALNPVGAAPTPLPMPAVHTTSEEINIPSVTPAPTFTPLPTTTAPVVSPTPLPSPTALPQTVKLPAPVFEQQDWNACGPATLAMHLRMYGWEGDQFIISGEIKPNRRDRNVNVEELAAYVINSVPDLEVQYRVGGNLDMLKRLLASGFPVMIEESFKLPEAFWFEDDLWSGHYLLLTGYDDAARTFIAKDSYIGRNQIVRYADLEANWKTFNRVYFVLYPPDQQELVAGLLGAEWNRDANRQHALDAAQTATEADPRDSFAWFNLGTNLVYFERYAEASQAYDTVRQLGMPQRMLRYQFGPFHAYFHAGRTQDLLAMTEYALKSTPNSEEALLWQGWGLYRQGDRDGALASFEEALTVNPLYADAQYAINYVAAN
ncbi:MAG: C39 family peptidase [Anaerolineaceae bacterium]|nr:C39 family peptidase [Anaerolineaceae bacterium]